MSTSADPRAAALSVRGCLRRGMAASRAGIPRRMPEIPRAGGGRPPSSAMARGALTPMVLVATGLTDI